jgi:hypothetical protein
MDTNIILTVFGITITLLLGALGIYFAIRYSRQVGITYIEDSCIALIDDITQGITDLEILFRKSPVSKNIVLLKGYIYNAGKRDITKEMIEKRLRLVLPEGYEWIDCQINHRAKDLKVDIAEVKAQYVEFDFGLLKTKEYFGFDALAIVPSKDDDSTKEPGKSLNVRLQQNLTFDHRIADIHEIKKIRLRDFQMSSFVPPRMEGVPLDRRLQYFFARVFRIFSPLWLAILLIVIGIAFYFLLLKATPKSLAYEIDGLNNQSIVVNMRIKGEMIELYNWADFQKTLTPKEFNQLKKTALLQPPDVWPIIIYSGLYSGIGILMLIFRIISFFRKRKYQDILRLTKKLSGLSKHSDTR